MLREHHVLFDATAMAGDGGVGKVVDILFRDGAWTIQYIVLRTGDWLAERKVLAPRHSLRDYDRNARVLHLGSTRSEVSRYPALEADLPVSHQQSHRRGSAAGPTDSQRAGDLMSLLLARTPSAAGTGRAWDSPVQRVDTHLRSAAEVSRYTLVGRDGTLGRVRALLIDDTSWTLRGVVHIAHVQSAAREILIPSPRILHISWEAQTILTDTWTGELAMAPEYTRLT
jgi:hypothetical protein